MDCIWPSIHSRADATFAYTPGIDSMHPIPHAVIPICVYRFWSGRPTGHTNGAPPSPYVTKQISILINHIWSVCTIFLRTRHVSMPASPPAQMNDVSSRNRSPSRVPRNAVSHCQNETIGSGTFFMITLCLPALPDSSLPQPLTKHFGLSGTSPRGGKQTVAMWSSNLNGSFNSITALNFMKENSTYSENSESTTTNKKCFTYNVVMKIALSVAGMTTYSWCLPFLVG